MLKMIVKTAYSAKNNLGEGPVWNIEEQALYWVDILNRKLQKWKPGTGAFHSWDMPEHIGCYAFRKQGGAIIALRSGIYSFDFETERLESIVKPEGDRDNTRFNDGACDRAGRFFAGTMTYEETIPEGNLYRLDPDHQLSHMRSGIKVSNGLGWSPDNQVMYYADSPTQCIFAFDYDIDSGRMTNERIFCKIEQGYPDGLTVDAEGYVWLAVWDGWRIVRYAPDGSIDKTIEMPIQRPTSCMFGGPNLNQLYITSAIKNLPVAELEKQPEAGNIFVIEVDVPGLPEPLFMG